MERVKKTDKATEASQFQWETIAHYRTKFNDYEFPPVSIVIPTLDCAQNIKLTLDSVLSQDYPELEVVIVDGESRDRTLELIKGFKDSRVKTFVVSTRERYEMLNKGISQVTGRYVAFLFPGDFYIHHDVLRYMMSVALEHHQPDLVYCGTLIRDGKKDVKILYRELNDHILQRGNQPTSLQSCWFKKEVFQQIGKFDPEYKLRGGFDLFCRFERARALQHVGVYRVLTDYDLHLVTHGMVLRHFWETFSSIKKHYGLWSAFLWCFRQKDFSRFLRLWFRSVHAAFLGR